MRAAVKLTYVYPLLLVMAVSALAADPVKKPDSLAKDDLVLDLDAEKDVVKDQSNRVLSWKNQRTFKGVDYFVEQDALRNEIVANPSRKKWWYQAPRDEHGVKDDTVPTASGKPLLIENIPELNGHSAIEFRHDELQNDDADAFDGFHTTQGYTWFVVIKVEADQLHDTTSQKGTPNAFFGTIQSSGDPDFEGKYFSGFWGGVWEDYRIWGGSRNGLSMKGVALDTPRVGGDVNHGWNIIAFRQGAGQDGDTVKLELFVNDMGTVANSMDYKISTLQAGCGALTIGQERNAKNHMGTEAFRGQMARFLIYKKPLSSSEMKDAYACLYDMYLK